MSDLRNLWGLRLLAVALAILAWFFFSVEQREQISEKVIEATVRYENYPGLVLLDRVETVRVGVRGPVSKMRNLNPFLVDVSVEVDNPERGIFEVPLSAQNVFVPDNLEVVSVEPNVLPVELDEEIDQLLAVAARIEGEPAAGAVVLDIGVSPALALVRGPRSRIAQATGLSTTPLDLSGHALDFEQQAAVVSPDPLIRVVQPAVVTVRIALEIPGTTSDTVSQ